MDYIKEFLDTYETNLKELQDKLIEIDDKYIESDGLRVQMHDSIFIPMKNDIEKFTFERFNFFNSLTPGDYRFNGGDGWPEVQLTNWAIQRVSGPMGDWVNFYTVNSVKNDTNISQNEKEFIMYTLKKFDDYFDIMYNTTYGLEHGLKQLEIMRSSLETNISIFKKTYKLLNRGNIK